MKGCIDMNEYEWKATNLIAQTFEKYGAKFDVVNSDGVEQLLAGFSVDCGPNVMMRFINQDDDNDVAARIYGLVSNIPQEKRLRVMEACNILNRKVRFIKFYLDTDGDINVEYDFPMHSTDDGIGEMAFEIFIRVMHVLDDQYEIFMKALYTEEELQPKPLDMAARLERLQHLREMLESRLAADENVDNKNPEDTEADTEAEGTPDDEA